jgi:hypothetical protein
MIRVRAMIPESWAAKGNCPLCGAMPLLHRPTLEADQLACPKCDLAFEVEDGGPHIRVKQLPAQVSAAPDGEWRTPREARHWIRAQFRTQAAPPKETPPPPAPLVVTPTGAPAPQVSAEPEIVASAGNAPRESIAPACVTPPAEALTKARRLFDLGQTPAQIQSVLARASEYTAEQVQAVMVVVAQWEAARRAKQQRKLLRAFGIIGSLVLAIGIAAVLVMAPPGANALQSFVANPPSGASSVTLNPGQPAPTVAPTGTVASVLEELGRLFTSNNPGGVPGNPSAATPAPGTAINNQLPPLLQTLIPPGVSVINAPTPEVRHGDGPPVSACPRTRAEAAELFGGEPDQWQPAENVRGWMVFSTTTGVTVRVPESMTLGYLQVGNSLSLTDVNGPATVTNVYMGAISCE